MKAQVYNVDFKAMVEKVALNQLKNTTIPIFSIVKITALNDKLTAEGTDAESYISISIPATVFEPGFIYATIDNLKKTTGIKTDFVVVQTDDGAIRVEGLNKKYEITQSAGEQLDEIFKPFLDDYNGGKNFVAQYDEGKFIVELGATDGFRSDNDNNKLMTCFNINTAAGRIATLDGHRIAIAKISGDVSLEDKDINVPGCTYKILKGLRGKTKDIRDLYIYESDKYIHFVSEDYIFATRRVGGTYFNVDKMVVDYNRTESYTFNIKELKSVAKEYKDNMSKDKKIPMLMFTKNGDICTAMAYGGYKTMDVLEGAKINHTNGEKFIRGLNPVFIYEGMSIFDGDTVEMVTVNNDKQPVMFTADNRQYIVLPVNLAGNESLIAYVEKLAA